MMGVMKDETEPRAGLPGAFSWRDFDPASLDGSASRLAEELTTYRDRLDEILAHEGESVVIRGRRVAGYHGRQSDAIAAAFADFGREPVLIKRVVESEPGDRLGLMASRSPIIIPKK